MTYHPKEAPEDVIKEEDIFGTDYGFGVNVEGELIFAKFTDTNSMIPVLDFGHNSIELKCPCDIKVGDIISFMYEEKLIAHRVIEVKSNMYKTKGDNSLGSYWVKEEDVKGKVIAILY